MKFKNNKMPRMGKSGITVLAAINLIPKMVLLTIILLCAWIFVYNFLAKEKDISNLKSLVQTQKLIYSKEISFYDGNRYYPGIIDIEKFNNDNLNKIFYFDYNKYMSMKIVLKTKNNDITKEVIVNNERYQDMLTRSWFTGKGSTKRNILEDVVLVKDGDKFYNAVLEVEVLMEES